MPKDGEEREKELDTTVTEDELILHTFSPTRMSHSSPLHPHLSSMNPLRTLANDVGKKMPQSNGAKRGCAHVSGMKELFDEEGAILEGLCVEAPRCRMRRMVLSHMRRRRWRRRRRRRRWRRRRN
ncbi:transporter arsB [Canna indica]|uniref:Transporter arsB n=1 Tax=Canna indica TaxID=4628 RepID=A0AAQ3Q7D7_9LILI|nr:transporter arsB [Canna indica]